jgi:hypothetical protein
MQKHTLFIFLLAVGLSGATMATMTSCGDDPKEDTIPGGGGNDDDSSTPGSSTDSGTPNLGNNDSPTPGSGDGSGPTDALNSSAAGDYLNETAQRVLNLFDANDQQKTLQLAKDFLNTYGDYDMPDNFDFEDDEDDYYAPSLNKTMQLLIRSCKGNVSAATRAVEEWVCNFNLHPDELRGVYEPVSREEAWVKKESSNDIIFRFWHNGATCELKVVFSSRSWDLNFSNTEMEDYSWGGYHDTYNYYLTIPSEVSFTLTEGGTTLVSGNVTSAFSDKTKMTANVDVTIENIRSKASYNATNTTIAVTQEMTVSGTRVYYASATLQGNHLCDKDRLASLFDYSYTSTSSSYYYGEEHYGYDDASIGDYLTAGTAELTVLDRVTVRGSISDFQKFSDNLDSDDDESTNDAKEAAARKSANLLNGICQGQLFFNSTVKQADVTWQAYLYDTWYWNNKTYEDWGVEPIMTFVNGGGSYTFEEYFDDLRFGNLTDIFSDVYDTYERYWR